MEKVFSRGIDGSEPTDVCVKFFLSVDGKFSEPTDGKFFFQWLRPQDFVEYGGDSRPQKRETKVTYYHQADFLWRECGDHPPHMVKDGHLSAQIDLTASLNQKSQD